MVATRDFSGLISPACAWASAAAMVPIDSLDWCMAALHAQDLEAHRTGFGALGSDVMADRLLGILGDKPLELCFGVLVLEIGLTRAPKHTGEFGPRVGRAHVDNPDRFNARPRWLRVKEARGLAAPDAAPEFLFRRQKQVLVKRIG